MSLDRLSEPTIAGICACGNPLPSMRATWCSPSCNLRRSQYRKVRGERKDVPRRRIERTAIGIDGEGFDRKYVLLAASNGTYVENYDGLDTDTCFEFLLSLPSSSHHVFGFAFSYDVNMILSSLSEDELRRLSRTSRVYYGDYNIKHIPGKQLIVSHRPTGRSCTVWDLYPWIQSSFVKMLREFELADEATIDRIAKMKDQREDFSHVSHEAIRTYCIEECDLLSKAVTNVLGLIDSTGFKPNGYYSPGSLAAAAMERNGVRTYRKDPPTEDIRRACDDAYYGGRSEVSLVGPVEGPIFEYDIRSAYPFAATLLPCFSHGRWVRYNGDIMPYSLVKVRWQTSRQAVWGPYPIRPATGSLRYPRSGETWVWGVEALAGKGLCTSFDVLDGYTWLPSCDHKPFAYLEDFYRARAKLKAAGNPQEYIYKLILNSTYGKLGQRMGSYTDRIPRHRFQAWAGLITAHTRSMLLEQIGAIGEDLLLCATDGLITRKALSVTIGSDLGQWETNNYASLFIAGPGFYFADGESVERSKTRNRGIARGDISFERIGEEWLHHGRVGSVRTSTRRFIGYRLALARLNTPDIWRQFTTVPITKRFDLEPRREWLTDDPFDGRSIAPSLKAHKALAKQDEALQNQMSFRFWKDIADSGAKLETLGGAISTLDPWSSFPAYEQPDYLLDELDG